MRSYLFRLLALLGHEGAPRYTTASTGEVMACRQVIYHSHWKRTESKSSVYGINIKVSKVCTLQDDAGRHITLRLLIRHFTAHLEWLNTRYAQQLPLHMVPRKQRMFYLTRGHQTMFSENNNSWCSIWQSAVFIVRSHSGTPRERRGGRAATRHVTHPHM